MRAEKTEEKEKEIFGKWQGKKGKEGKKGSFRMHPQNKQKVKTEKIHLPPFPLKKEESKEQDPFLFE